MTSFTKNRKMMINWAMMSYNIHSMVNLVAISFSATIGAPTRYFRQNILNVGFTKPYETLLLNTL
jgi:hypothetical protein